MSDTLLQRVAAMDEAAMQECMKTYGGLVWSLARRLSPTVTDAEEAVQEIFVSVWESAARYDPARMKEATFVAMIARRRLIDRFRRGKRRRSAESNVDVGVDEGVQPVSAPNPSIEGNDDVKHALEAFSTLNEHQQQAIRLAITEGLSHQQIAERTGAPLGTVKTHIRRGLNAMREKIESRQAGRAAGVSS